MGLLDPSLTTLSQSMSALGVVGTLLDSGACFRRGEEGGGDDLRDLVDSLPFLLDDLFAGDLFPGSSSESSSSEDSSMEASSSFLFEL